MQREYKISTREYYLNILRFLIFRRLDSVLTKFISANADIDAIVN